METHTVLTQLHHAIAQHKAELNALKARPDSELRQPPQPGKWSAVDCMEHLNLTYQYYLPALEKALRNPAPSTNAPYRPGWFGKMMINSMQPKGEKRGIPMKTFSRFQPDTTLRTTETIFEQYRKNLDQLEHYLQRAESLDLNKNRVVSAMGPILKFKLGDCFRFLVAHDARHFLQAKLALQNSPELNRSPSIIHQ